MNNVILSILTGTQVTNSKTVIEQGFAGISTHTAGCQIKTNKVYSICSGRVLSVSQDPYDDTWTITVENTSQRWIRYCHLDSCKVVVGQMVSSEDLLGNTSKNSLRLEYCTSEVSQFPVRELNRQLYKHDPTPIIFGMMNLSEAY